MSANRTRLLFADDTELLAPARTAMLSRPEFDVQMAGSTDEAMQIASDGAPPGAIVLPADGEIDGVQVCRSVRSMPRGKSVPIVLVLPADSSERRDACFAAGADDVIFSPVDAADIAQRLDRNAPPFRSAPRASVDLVVRIASPTGNAVIDTNASQISREAVMVSLPAGITPPAPGILVRAVFTLYEGGTVQVWARVAPAPEPSRTVLRFVGLTEAERESIDYFVGFYRTRSGADDAVEEGEATMKSDVPRDAPSPAEALPTTAEAPRPATAPDGSRALSPSEALRVIGEATLETIADAASSLASGKGTAVMPKGFDAARMKGWLPKLAPTESSALRGTTTYSGLIHDLRSTAAAKLRLFELVLVLRENGSKLDKATAERISLEAITESQQIHNALEAAFQELLKAGNTAAVRDLTPVKSGLLSACVDLKTTLDRDVLGKGPAGASPRLIKAPSQVRYERLDPASPPQGFGPDRPSRDKVRTDAPPPVPGVSDGRMSAGKKKATAAILVVLAAGALWSNSSVFVAPREVEFRPGLISFEHRGVRVWTSIPDATTGITTFIVDSTWVTASEDARKEAVDEMASRAAGAKAIRVIDYKERELANRSL